MNVIVTGGSGALGSAVVDTFLDAGHTVMAVGRQRTAAEHPSGRLRWANYDLTTAEASVQLMAQAVRELGGYDVVVHTMGAFAGGQTLAAVSDDTWSQMMALNLYSAFYVFRAALPRLLDRRYGRLVAIGTRTAVQPAPGLAAYTVSKAGLHALVATLALELKGTGVTANVVLPSVIDTPANRAAMPKAEFGKWVQPRSIANLLLWLASEQAADVNGAAIPVYGAA
ncbi:MAG TPA: SDR family NAD(P)-dependent oxidoreductase [Bryobacteraceae bacterium]|nr:SDR family NAD(P)-dependent oxidoreductase [Bryobacteraceae bacterium]